MVSVLKCAVDTGSAGCHSTRFKSNSTDVAFGCMFRTHTMTFGNTTAMAAVGSIIGMDVGMGTAGASRGGSDVCGTVVRMVADCECLHRQPCFVSLLLGICCAMLVQRNGIAVASRVRWFAVSNG